MSEGKFCPDCGEVVVSVAGQKLDDLNGPFRISEQRPSEEQIRALIAARAPAPKPECERCLFAFHPRRCFNCTVQGGDGEQYVLPWRAEDDD